MAEEDVDGFVVVPPEEANPVAEAAIETGELAKMVAGAAPCSAHALEAATGVVIKPKSWKRTPVVLSEVEEMRGKGHGLADNLKDAEEHDTRFDHAPTIDVQLRHIVCAQLNEFALSPSCVMIYDGDVKDNTPMEPVAVPDALKAAAFVNRLASKASSTVAIYDTVLPENRTPVRFVVFAQQDADGKRYSWFDPIAQLYTELRGAYSQRVCVLTRNKCFVCRTKRGIRACKCKVWFACRKCMGPHVDCTDVFKDLGVEMITPDDITRPLPECETKELASYEAPHAIEW